MRADVSDTSRSFASATMNFFRRDSVVFVVLGVGFVARWLLAGTHSYWLDELYSVAVYGVWNDSVIEAINSLASSSVHPPLYQSILYGWMSWLGDGEEATRLLSNLYVTLAGFFLYMLVRDAFNRMVALWSTAVFSLMYATMYFGLEARSYAQTIFLATLSSYLLLRIMTKGAERGWRSAISSLAGLALVLVNTALLLTHYYNGFFLIAQAFCVAVFIFVELSPRKWITGLGTAGTMYGLPVALFAAIWGRTFIATYRVETDASAAAGALDPIGPIELIRDGLFHLNLSAPGVALIAGGTLMTAILVRSAIALSAPKPLDHERRSAYTTFYLIAWLILPLAGAYAAMSLLGVDRFSDRYFLFSTVALAPIIVLIIAEAWRLVSSISQRLRRVPFAGVVGITSVIVIATTIAPGTYSAAASDKADWRGIAQEIIGVVESDPDSSYTLYETSFRTTPILDYYLARYSEGVRVDGTIRRAEERSGGDFDFEKDESIIEQHDYLIVAFTHHSTRHFPIALANMEERYEVQHRHLDPGGRGYVVFRTGPEQGR